MPGWSLVDTHPTKGCTFRRLLGASERGFFWDSLFNGTADCIQHLTVRLLNGSQDAHLFSRANIMRAWLSTKRRYPLVGATVQGPGLQTARKIEGIEQNNNVNFTSDLHFVVREGDLSVVRPHEIVFGQVADAEEVQLHIAAILDGPRPLSAELLVQLYVFQETNARTDTLHIVTLMGHCVTDGMANRTLMRCLLDTLARGGGPDVEPSQAPLECRLAMVVPSVELEPMLLRSLTPARRRWRRAIALVILQLRKGKMKGGYTIPCRLTHSTYYTLAQSCEATTSLTPVQSAAVIANCRQHNLTFGNSYLVLAQVAMTRVLYRRYLRGEISEEEWEYKKRQPYISAGALNLRPYLDEGWFKMGGGGEFMLCIGVYIYQLPFMTLGGTAKFHRKGREHIDIEDAPPFLYLLTFERFLHRVGLVKKQAKAFFTHPLFFEIVHAEAQQFSESQRVAARRWMKCEVASVREENLEKNKILKITDIPFTWAHWGSSFGNIDPIFPLEYPLPRANMLSPYSPTPHPTKAGYIVPTPSAPPFTSDVDMAPRIVVEYAKSRLHTRPGELYLGAATSRGQLNMYIFYDGNVYEEGVVKEWLAEVKGAVLSYLG